MRIPTHLTLLSAILLFACTGSGGISASDWSGRILERLPQELAERSEMAGKPQHISLSEKDKETLPVPVNERDPVWGRPDAPVTLVIYSDFDCPFCSKYAQAVKALKEKYGELVRVVFKQFPLPFHPEARPKAMMALAAHSQGRFWPMHDVLFAGESFTQEEFTAWAAGVGINMDLVARELGEEKHDGHIEADLAEGRRLGINGTPCTFVNGVMVVGAVPTEMLEEQIQLGLARARVLLKHGVRPDQVYGTLTGTLVPETPSAEK